MNKTESNRIPDHPVLFVIRTIKEMRGVVALSIIVGVVSAWLGYTNTYLISDLIENVERSSFSELVNSYFVPIVLVLVATQLSGYVSRRHLEPLTIKFKDIARENIYHIILKNPFNKTLSFDKNKLHSLTDEYVNTANSFLSTILGTPSRLVSFGIACWVLYERVPAGIILIAFVVPLFCAVFVSLSQKYIALSKVYSEYIVLLESRIKHMFQSLNQNKANVSLRLFEFGLFQREREQKWAEYDKVKSYHAYRWAVQLSSFNLIHVGFLLVVAHRISIGVASIGDIVLINWVFGQFSSFLIFATELIVDLKKTSVVSKRNADEINCLFVVDNRTDFIQVGNEYVPELDMNFVQNKFTLVTGPNGIGKSTNVLMKYGGLQNDCHCVSVMTPHDTLFDELSIRENILLDKEDGFLPSFVFRTSQDNSIGLSSGEKQLIRIYRCANQDADVYIFDEPCVNLDDTNLFVPALEYLRGKTVIVISHQEINFTFDRYCDLGD